MPESRWLAAARALRTGWTMIGLTLVLALGLECAAQVALAVRNRVYGVHHRKGTAAFADSAWAEDYFDELERLSERWRSYVYWRRRPFAGRYINVDEEGRRRTWREPAAATTPDPVRVFAFGGSTLWGVGARDEFTIPSLLAKGLAERLPGTPVEVTNYAEFGYVSTQELVVLELALQRGEVPDVVLFYDGINDVFASFQNGQAGSPQNESDIRVRFESLPLAVLLRVLDDSAALSPLVRRVRNRTWERAYASRSAEQRERLASDTVGIYAANLAIARALGERWGFRTAFYWQPALFTKRRPAPDELQDLQRAELWKEFYLAVSAGVRADEALSRSVDFHAIDDVFGDDDRALYFDCCHVNEAGNEIVARRILPDVVALVAARREETAPGYPATP